MRQGNGTDLLGVNDPRSASIGVIYVATNDDRKSVLAAIITQDKLGRKQVAVVLPQSNKAFQRPVDFDDLRSWRRKLHTQIVFIAPSGSGAAEHARRLRFPVYSSLETYTKSLNEGEAAEKKHWLFGAVGGAKQKQKQPTKDEAGQHISSAKPSQDTPGTPRAFTANGDARHPAGPPVEDEYEDDEPVSYARGARNNNNGIAFAAGTALGAASLAAANAAHHSDDEDTDDVRAHALADDEDGIQDEDEDLAIAPRSGAPLPPVGPVPPVGSPPLRGPVPDTTNDNITQKMP